MTDGPAVDLRVDRLARTAWGEARGEGLIGMHAVINTVQNRLKVGRYGKTLVGICMMADKKGVHVYSCWNGGDANRAKLLSVTPSDAQYALALGLADRAVFDQLDDVTGGATHYYRDDWPEPYWAKKQEDGRRAVFTGKIGRHLFFKDVP